jgi:hypothetical protein
MLIQSSTLIRSKAKVKSSFVLIEIQPDTNRIEHRLAGLNRGSGGDPTGSGGYLSFERLQLAR